MKEIFMEQKFSQQISDFLQLLDQAQKSYVWSQSEITRLDQLTPDYLHLLELQDRDYHNLAQVASSIKQCRINRRQHKDNIAFLEPLVTLLSSEKGKLIVSQLQQTLGAVRKAERVAQDRHYTPRVLSLEEYENPQIIS